MRRLSGVAWRLACVLILAAGLPAAGGDTPQASGEFAYKGGSFDLGGAYAFPSRVGLDNEEGIKVAISNAGFRADAVDRFWDREAYIDTRFADDETAVVYLHFRKDGKFVGASWYFGPGQGCGFCSTSHAVSTVKVSGGRIGGSVKVTDDDTTYDATFDVPIAPPLPGQEIAKDGGEPGKAYLAYHNSLGAGDEAGVLALVTAEDRERFTAAKAKGSDFMAYLSKDHPEEVTIVRAFTSGDWATLVIRGKESWGDLHGEAQMKREDGTWRYWDEMFDAGDWLEGRGP